METQEFKNKVNEVATILKMKVEFPSDEDMRSNKWAYLTKEHQKIRISSGYFQSEHKLHIYGDFPRTEKRESCHYGPSASINVSDSKTAKQVARDIERRFLPVYLPTLQEVLCRVDKTNIYDQKRKANIQKMADYLGVEFKEGNRGPLIYVYNELPGLGSKIEAVGEDAVRFELELTPDLAIKVFDLLNLESGLSHNR